MLIFILCILTTCENTVILTSLNLLKSAYFRDYKDRLINSMYGIIVQNFSRNNTHSSYLMLGSYVKARAIAGSVTGP